MLLELRAENYAIIDRTAVEFGPGLNLLTGETGAGKSILIDALLLLLGGKASADAVRHGETKAVIGCVFESTPGAIAVLEANGIDPEGEEIVLRREVQASGKGRVFINNQPATVGVLRQLAPELALVHTQSETLVSFDSAQQRLLLDRSADISATETAGAFAAWRELRDKLEALRSADSDRLRAIDLLSFQAGEIESVAIEDGEEDVRLGTEKRLLANAERLLTGARAAIDLLYEAETSAEGLLGSALRHVEDVARFQESFRETAAQLASARIAIEDATGTLRDFAEGAAANPERLAEIEDRLASFDRLKRKYGPTLAEVVAFGEQARARLEEFEDRDARIAELEREQAAAAEGYRRAAGRLTEQRREAAGRLARSAERQVNDLAMRARLAIEITSEDAESGWTAEGWDRVEYRIATNAGEPLKPLTEIASGGEMSRIMLALKTAVEQASGKQTTTKTATRKRRAVLPRTLIFDEIDIGIGGRAAEAVGQKLKELSRAQQVLCITHLPQIAAFADRHLLIEKNDRGGRTQTRVRTMDDPERVEEIARMLSGASLTDASRLHAEQMLAASR